MGEIFEPLDPADAEAIAEGAINPDDARAVDIPELETGQDRERLVVLEDRRASETEQELDSGDNVDIEDVKDPAQQ